MWRRFCNWLLFTKRGWTVQVTVDHPARYIIALAPHTSNWDFILGKLYAGANGWKINFLMKKEWFVWPLGYIFKALGGIPVYRSEKHNLTEQLVDIANRSKEFHLCITPEGTRQKTDVWKKGFYYIALNAHLPILLYGIDYEKRLIQCTKVVYPSGNINADMKDIMEYYKPFKGKKANNFSTENIPLDDNL